MKYRIGQLVINNKLGLGKVLEVRGDNVTVFFKDQKDNPRIINVRVVPMAVPKEQTDPYFDEAKGAKHRSRKPVKKRVAKPLATRKAKA